MRKALIVGIDYYEHLGALGGCVNDALAVKAVLERHADGTVNFAAPKVLTGSAPDRVVTKSVLKTAVRELFSGSPEIALLYFAGHGQIEDTGGYLYAGDSPADDGLALSEVMTLVSKSRADNKVIILDSCHSGAAGNRPDDTGVAEIKEGMTVLSATTEDQSAFEVDGTAGVFTRLFVDALNGAAANLVGDITPGSVYAHIDQSLGPWAQRPVFKTNVKSFVSLRRTQPPIELADLQALATHFPSADYVFRLDPSYEPERFDEHRADPTIPPPDPRHTAVFAVLQKYVRVNLVRPVGAPHMWHAAMQSKACELTVLGQHYQKLVAADLL